MLNDLGFTLGLELGLGSGLGFEAALGMGLGLGLGCEYSSPAPMQSCVLQPPISPLPASSRLKSLRIPFAQAEQVWEGPSTPLEEEEGL